MTLRAAQLIHNARNSLVGIADRIESLNSAELAEIHHVARLLANAMAALRLGNGNNDLSLDEVELDDFFASLSSEAKRLSPEHLVTSCQADFSACLFNFWTFDSQLVQMAVLDALSNAWRHAVNTVMLEMRWKDGELIFTVRDDGPGYPIAYLSVEGIGTTQSSIGTGHGLQIAREIAERHVTQGRQGRITLENGSGAIFRMFLP